MTRVRPPVAAGTFYPGRAGALASLVDRLLEAAQLPDGGLPEVLIVPHAGYEYSGPVAAVGYAALRRQELPSRLVLLGPAHFWPLHGTAVPAADAWATPLGEVAIDAELREAAGERGAVIDDRPHADEHALEVQLPFLQRLAAVDLEVLPVAVGIADPGAVADLVAALSGGLGATIVVSTDLSHYHDAETARRLDRRTADAIVARDPSAIGTEDACGVHALRGVLEHARRSDLGVRMLDLRTSADTAGDPRRVVGYGAFALGAAGGGA